MPICLIEPKKNLRLLFSQLVLTQNRTLAKRACGADPTNLTKGVDGLALSSRNTRLSLTERHRASRLAEILVQAAKQLSSGQPVKRALTDAREAILAAGFSNVEYLELRADGDLASILTLDRPARLLVAAWLGQTRLIDNVQVHLARSAVAQQAAA